MTVKEKIKPTPKTRVLSDTERIDQALTAAARQIIPAEKMLVTAERFIKSHRGDPGWDGWVQSQIVEIVHERLRSQRRSDRSTAVASRGFVNFKNATAHAPTVSLLEVGYSVNSENEWKSLKDMDKKDLLFVASDYRKKEDANRIEAMFFEALAKKVGRKTVGDSFTPQSLEKFREALRT